LIPEKTGDSLAKWVGRTGTHRRGRSDLDPTAHIKGGRDLISPADVRSNGLGAKGHELAALRRRRQISWRRGSGRRTSPASGAPGARAGPRLQQLAHKFQGRDVMLTRGLRRLELQRRLRSTTAGGEGGRVLADRRLQTGFRRLLRR
jgi:hypothetical protein